MKAEVAIVNGNAWEVYEDVKANEKIGKEEYIFAKFTKHVTEEWHTDKDENGKPKAILGDPQYVAIHVKWTRSIRVILEIDYEKSNLLKGEICPQGYPIRVYIPIKKYSQDRLHGIRYTTFRTFITHESTADFTTPKVK